MFSPLRFVRGMAIWAVVLFLSPILFLFVLLLGFHRLSSDEIGLMKVLAVVIGPFASTFWFILISVFSRQRRARRLISSHTRTGDGYSESELRFLERENKPRHLTNLLVLLLSFSASVCCAYLFSDAGDLLFFLGVSTGIVSPALVVLLKVAG